jgi:hypothetical protein
MTNTVGANSERELLEVWQHYVHSEFGLKDAKRALTTMSSDPHVLLSSETKCNTPADLISAG